MTGNRPLATDIEAPSSTGEAALMSAAPKRENERHLLDRVVEGDRDAVERTRALLIRLLGRV